MMPEVGHAPATIETELSFYGHSCEHCQQEQLVHVQALTGAWSTAHQSLECLRCGQYFEVLLPDAVIGGPFLPPDLSSAQ
jgi:ribosomal protein S27E